MYKIVTFTLFQEHVNMKDGLGMEQAKRMATRMGFAGSSADEAADYFIKMYNLFVEKVKKSIRPIVDLF